MSLVTSFQSLADICPHHKTIKFGTILDDWQSLLRKGPVLEQQGLQVHWQSCIAVVCALPACTMPGSPSCYQL